MPAFDFSAPGAGIRKLLLLREAQVRQERLDEERRQQQKIENDRANRQLKIDEAAEARVADAAARKTAASTYRIGDVMRPGDTTTPADMTDTTMAARHMRPGLGLSGPQASPSLDDLQNQPDADAAAAGVPGVIQAAPQFDVQQARRTFTGSGEQRDVERKKQGVLRIIQDNPDLIKANPELKAMLQVAAETDDYGPVISAIASATREGTPRTAGGLTIPQEAQQVLAYQRQWDRSNNAHRATQDSLSKMEAALQRFDVDPTGSSEAIRVLWEKMLDPNSVVREGEYARQVDGQSLMDWMKGKYQAWVEGGGEIPKAILNGMVETAKTFQGKQIEFNKADRARVERNMAVLKIDPARVFNDPVTPAAPAGAPGAAPAAPAAAAAPDAPPAAAAPAGPPAAPPVTPGVAAPGPAPKITATIPRAKAEEFARARGLSYEDVKAQMAARGVGIAE